MISFIDFVRSLNEANDKNWDVSLALPGVNDENYQSLKSAFSSGLIWTYNRTSKSYQIVFNKNSNLQDTLAGAWQRDAKGHMVLQYRAADGKNVTLRSTGKSGAESTQGSASNQEAGVVYWLAKLIGNDALYQSKIPMEQTELWLDEHSKWNDQCKDTAQIIIKTLGRKLKSFEFHHGTTEYNALRSLGKSLSGLSEDRWNPADIILIKNDRRAYSQALMCRDIEEYNSYFSDLDNCELIGISLKGAAALHGATALSSFANHPWVANIVKKFRIPPKIKTNGVLDINTQRYALSLYDDVSRIKSPLVQTYNVDKTKTIAENIAQWGAVASTWGASFPYGMTLLTCCRNSEDLRNLALTGYMYAKSAIVGVSAPFWKATPNSMTKYEPDFDAEKFELKRVRVPVDGSTNIIFDIAYDGNIEKLQLRSKSFTNPQFMIIKRNEMGTKAVPLKMLSLGHL